ncbi:hypothetical protein JW921_06495 [Candidatus Fermentibacterales bacterium]|nr:hypothetical protein [Candidatus Fermentibacterales bacterium]
MKIREVPLVLAMLVAIAGAAQLFEDSFDDGNADGWTEYSNYPDSTDYYVEAGWYHLLVSGCGNANVFSFNGDNEGTTPHQMSIPDYTVFCQVVGFSPTDHVGVVGRMFTPLADEKAYVLWMRYNAQSLELWRHDGPASFSAIATCALPLSYEQVYWVRFDLWGGLLRGKVWQGSFRDEPEEYLLSAYDTTYPDPGSVGFGAHSFDYATNYAAFDSVMVCDPLSLDAGTWGAIKSSF